MNFNFFFSSQPLLRKIIKHSSILFSGQVLFTLFGIGSLIVTARALGAEKLGILTLIQTSIFIISAFLLPKPWLTIVRFGANLESSHRYRDFKGIIRLSFLIEIIAAFIAGIVTILLAPVILKLITVKPEYYHLFIVYAFTLFFNVSGTAIGLLRHHDEVNWIRNIEIFTGIVKFILALTGFMLEYELGFFVIAFAIAEAVRFILTNLVSYLVSYRPKYKDIDLHHLFIRFPELNDIFKFSISMHFIDLLGTARRELDLVVVGVLLNPQYVGYYKVIKQFSKMFSLLGNPIKQAVYPDICKLWADKNLILFNRTQLQLIGLLLITFSLIATGFWFISDSVVHMFFGIDYRTIVEPLRIYVSFSAFFMAFQILNAAVLAKGMGGKALSVEIITNVVYFLFMFLLLPSLQLFGVIYALGISIFVWIIMNGYYSFFTTKSVGNVQS